MLVDQNREIIYQSNLLESPATIEDTKYAELYKTLDFSSKNSSYKIDGDKYLVVPYRSDYTGWTTVAIIPQKQLLQGVDHIRSQTITILLIVLCLVFIISILVSNQITKSLKVLNDNIRKVSEGDFTSLGQSSSQDEVYQLSRGFNSMVDKINEMMKDMEYKEKRQELWKFKYSQAQISPHFLYNTLNTIIYLAALQNAQNIKEITASLIDLLRISIWNEDLYIPLSEELEHAKTTL